MDSFDRRRFLEFVGGSLAAVSAGPLAWAAGPFPHIPPDRRDQVILAPGFRHDLLVTWMDEINPKGERFGANNDYIAVLPWSNHKDELVMWVNHESPDVMLLHDGEHLKQRTREQVVREQEAVGGSLLLLKKQPDGRWMLAPRDPLNRRLSGLTPIPFVSERRIAGQAEAIGTMGNCAGGVTPWGTFLTCEENTDEYYGAAVFDAEGLRRVEAMDSQPHYGWQKYFGYPPEHYGWVVEVDPKSGTARKLTALGRFAHEGATVATARDGRQVVYMGDDENDQCIYKFISEKPGSLERGVLYVADVKRGVWVPLDRREDTRLRDRFRDQTELLIRCREAAHMVGGTPMNRPEAIAIHPTSKDIYVALTNNKPKGDFHGSLFRIREKRGDHLALEFSPETFLLGGDKTGFSCPDNIIFDRGGHLWMTCDVSGSSLNKGVYQRFGNNALFVIPTSGARAGQPFRIASAPNDAEFTGPCFAPDGQTLFLSVQHPGETSKAPGYYSSRWPRGDKPRSAVIAIRGPFPAS